MCTSRAPASRIMRTILIEVVPRTSESSIKTMRLPFTTARLAECLSRTPSSRMCCVGSAKVRRGLTEGAPDIMIADDAGFIRRARFLPVTDGGGNARVGHRDDDIGLGLRLACELRAQILPHLVNAASAGDRIRPRQINVLEDARARQHFRKRLHRLNAFLGNDDDL